MINDFIINPNKFKINDYLILNEIGSGSFGEVYKIYHKGDRKNYALKKIFHLYIFLEYAENGNLKKFIKKNYINDDIKLSFINDLFNGLNYIHSKNVIHRDLKSENILVTSNLNLKISDFGISILNKNDTIDNNLIGTPLYMSPELIQGLDFNYKTDLWSVGCIIYEIITKNIPFKSKSIHTLCYKIIKGEYNEDLINKTKYSPIIKRLLVVDQKNRSDLISIKNSFIFKRLLNKSKTNDKKLKRNIIILPKINL